jgi:hypothetical protein
MLDTGHFAPETHGEEIASHIRIFLSQAAIQSAIDAGYASGRRWASPKPKREPVPQLWIVSVHASRYGFARAVRQPSAVREA